MPGLLVNPWPSVIRCGGEYCHQSTNIEYFGSSTFVSDTYHDQKQPIIHNLLETSLPASQDHWSAVSPGSNQSNFRLTRDPAIEAMPRRTLFSGLVPDRRARGGIRQCCIHLKHGSGGTANEKKRKRRREGRGGKPAGAELAPPAADHFTRDEISTQIETRVHSHHGAWMPPSARAAESCWLGPRLA